MKGKLLFVVGLGVGYVLGTRAGRQRYEQIASAARSVWNAPTVQQGVGTVKEFALARVGDLSETVLDGVKHLVSQATKGQSAKPAASSAESEAPPPRPAAKRPAATKPAAAKPSGTTGDRAD